MLKKLVKKFFGSSEAVSTGAETSNILSLYALQHAEHFKCASSTDESAMFIDLNSVRSVEHNPPNYTLQFNMYLVEYKKKLLLNGLLRQTMIMSILLVPL